VTPSRRRVATVATLLLAAAAIVVGVWVVPRLLQYEDREPLRQAVSLAKAGHAAEALPVLVTFARDGDGPTMLLLAELYAHGIGVPYDEGRGAMWARKAAIAGLNVDGGFELGVARAYLAGDRGTRDPLRAAAWCVRAAEAGNRAAQELLANGTGIADPVTSAYWRDYLATSN
jgi:hypothetical protein